MCTGEMKYVILRIDTHVLRIDLCPRKRTRIRRQKQDEDVHLFLSERPLPRQGSWRGTRPNSPASADAPEASESVKQVVSRFPTRRKGSNKLFQGIRGLGKAQTSCFKVSEASERPKQVVSRNPRPRKGPNKLFQGFRRLGASADAGEFGRGVCGRRRILPGTRPSTYPGRGVLHTPPNRAARPEWDVPGRAVGPVDHSPGRNPGRRNLGRRNPGAKRHTPPQTGPPGPNGTYPAHPGFRPGL